MTLHSGGWSWAEWARRLNHAACPVMAQVTEAHTVVLAAPKGPLVKLDDKFYKLVDKMEALTQAGGSSPQ